MTEFRNGLPCSARMVVVLFIVSWPIWAQAAHNPIEHFQEAPVKREQIARLLQQLDSTEFQVREKALKTLRELGSAGHPHIRSLLHSLSLNARMQAESLLDDTAADGRRLQVSLKGTRVHVPSEETTAAKIMEILREEAGFRFMTSAGIDPETALFMEGGEFESLRVLNLLCTRLGVRWTQDYNSGAYRFYRGGLQGSPIEIYRGPFRIALSSFSATTNLQFGADATSNCYLRGQLDIEPEADVLGVIFQPRVLAVIDDKNRELHEKANVAGNFQPATNRRSFNFNIRIKRPDKDARQIKSLKIRVPVIVPAAQETVTIALDKESESSKAESGSLKVACRHLTRAGKRTFVQLQISRTIPFVSGAKQTDVVSQTITVTDPEGRTRPVTARATRTAQPDGSEVLRVELPPGTWQTLTFTHITEIETRVQEFEFKDVPLP